MESKTQNYKTNLQLKIRIWFQKNWIECDRAQTKLQISMYLVGMPKVSQTWVCVEKSQFLKKLACVWLNQNVILSPESDLPHQSVENSFKHLIWGIEVLPSKKSTRTWLNSIWIGFTNLVQSELGPKISLVLLGEKILSWTHLKIRNL